LKRIARAWIDDRHDYCNVHGWANRLDPRQTSYNASVREFRQARRWLRDDLRASDAFDYLKPVDGHAVFASLRNSPDGSEQVLIVANMEGGDAVLDPVQVDLPGLDPDGWHLQLRTPNIGSDYAARCVSRPAPPRSADRPSPGLPAGPSGGSPHR